MTKPLPPERTYFTGDTVIEQGEPAFEAYLITEGEADVFFTKDGKTAIIATLGAGEIFGEAALFKGSDYGATVKASGHLKVQPISPDILDEKIKSCDPMIRALIRMLMIRVRRANEAAAASEKSIDPLPPTG